MARGKSRLLVGEIQIVRILLDTDVVLDYILENEGHFDNAEQIFGHLDRGAIEVFVGSITPINVFYITRKRKNKEIAFQAVRFLLDSVQFCVSDQKIMENAFSLDFSDYEDAVQCASAVAENLDAIITRNAKDFVKSPIQIYSPAEFLEVLNQENKNSEKV
jgi:predicted nucleic-acid-binding protein